MKKLNNHGEVNLLLVGMIVFALLFITSTVFAVMYYGKYKDWKENVDPKINAAVDKATTEQKSKLDLEFEEKEKYPLQEYISSPSLGSVKVMYPKTWSAYVDEGTSNTTPIKGFFHPSFVPSVEKKIRFALRIELLDTSYANHLKSFDDKIKRKELTASAVQISGVTGTRLDGLLEKETNGSIVIMPLRDKTLRVWTESEEYRKDFDEIILKEFTFVP